MRFRISIFFVVLFSFNLLLAQNPQNVWQQYKIPEEAGWSSAKLNEAKKLYDSLGSAAYMLIYDGNVVVSWGDITRRFMCHSIRKSFLSAMYGILADRNAINLEKTIGESQINDNLPLTETEKSASIRDLLKARSGIYLPAAYETPRMKELRPKRSSHAPNTFWYYNNWDFNVLGTIYQRETGKDIFQDFQKLFAAPLQMEDYRETDGYYHIEPEHSIHPAYPFRMSARDMARFGQLFLQQGRWNDEQIVSAAWVKESTTSYSNAGNGGGYSYLWWTNGYPALPDFYTARGAGGHVIGVIPSLNVVFVHRADTYIGKRVEYEQIFRLTKMMLDARVSQAKRQPSIVAFQATTTPLQTISLPEDRRAEYIGSYQTSDSPVQIVDHAGSLMLVMHTRGRFAISPVADGKFFVEDLFLTITIGADSTGRQTILSIQR
ncbi:MAG: serine hydrolase [Ignavibacteria bacterium]|nr:serine hydrolase [Ignavibacteria bacterium]